MQKYKHLFLDFDDTIYDTHGNATLALYEAYEHFGLNGVFESFEEYAELYWKTNKRVWGLYSHGKISKDELMVERFLAPMRAKGVGTEQFSLEISDWFLIRTSEKTGLIEGALDLLEYLKPRYKMHILSNGFTEVQYKKIKNAGVGHYFDSVILSEMAGVNKPDPAIFDYALLHAGVKESRESVIMIGDNYDTDITGAINSNIDQIFFNTDAAFIPTVNPTYQVDKLLDIIKIL